MTLEYLELMEEMRKVNSEQGIVNSDSQRRKCVRSFKSNTRVFDDDSIEVTPQAAGTPSQTNVKKVGKSKRYTTTGKNPLTCIELKCAEDVTDKAAYFHKELAKLTKDMAIQEPEMPKGEYLIDKPNLKVCFAKGEHKVMAWLTFGIEGEIDVRKELYQLASEIDKCFVINSNLMNQQA